MFASYGPCDIVRAGCCSIIPSVRMEERYLYCANKQYRINVVVLSAACTHSTYSYVPRVWGGGGWGSQQTPPQISGRP